MTWAAVGVAGVGAAGSLVGGGKASKKAAKAQTAADNAAKEAAAYQQMWGQQNREVANQMNQQNAATQNTQTQANADWANQQNIANAGLLQGMNQQNIDYSNALNRANQDYAQAQNWESQIKGQGMNQAALDAQTAGNRLNTQNAFGGGVTYNPDGSVSQTLGEGDQSMMDTIYGKSNEIMQGMGGGFDVNGDVMNAYRAVNQPLVDQQRDQENARLAAMGLGTGSGMAWGNAQDALNRNQVNSDQNAILQGFQADQALRSSNRADLGAMGGVRSGIQAGLAQPEYWKQNQAALVNAPQQNAVNAATQVSQLNGVQGWQTPIAQVAGGAGAQFSPANQGIGQAAGQATQNQWNSLGQGAGQMTGAIIGGKNGSNPTMDQTANTYGTNAGSQQTAMLNAQDMGMGGGKR